MPGLPGEPGVEGIGIPGPKVCLTRVLFDCLNLKCVCMYWDVKCAFYFYKCLFQGDIGFRGLPGLPGPPGEGLQGPPVRNMI